MDIWNKNFQMLVVVGILVAIGLMIYWLMNLPVFNVFSIVI